MIRRSLSEHIGSVIVYTLLLVVGLGCLLPFVYVVSVSLSPESALAIHGATLIPREWSAESYQFILSYADRVLEAYRNTLIVTVVGTVIGLAVTAGLAYPLSKKNLPFRTPFMVYVLISMLITGGIIPFFLVIRQLGLTNTYWALILPGCFTPWNMILMRNFFMAMPQALEDSAYIDGANEVQILTRIVLPLSAPIMATVGLFLAVAFWNNWFAALLFLTDRGKWPIMMFLREVIEATSAADSMRYQSQVNYPPSQSLRMAVVVVCTAPILVVYPFAQKHFVKGVLIGSIKG